MAERDNIIRSKNTSKEGELIMKIAIFSDVFFPNINGVTTSLAHLMEELADRGHQIQLVIPSYEKSIPFAHKNIQILTVPSVPAMVYPGIRTGLLSPRLFVQVKKFNPDVIHVATPYTMGIIALLLSKLLKKPSVGVFHGYFMEPEYLKVIGITRGTSYVGSFIWQASKVFFDGCHVVVSPSEFVRKDLLKHKFKREILVCRNGVKHQEVKVSREIQKEFAKKYHIQDKNVLIYVGRLSLEKNLEVLLKVFREVVSKDPTVQLVIVGGGPILEDLQKLAQELNIDKQVVFTGEVEHFHLLRSGAYELATAFVTCSTSEVQPMTLIEAMFAGVPFCLAKARGNIELVKGNGYLVPIQKHHEFAEKILNILNNPSLQQKMRVASLELAKHYTIGVTAEGYEKAYRRAIEVAANSEFDENGE